METIVVAALVSLLSATFVALMIRRNHSPPVGDESHLSALREDLARLGERVASESSNLATRLEGIDSRMVQSQSANADLARSIFDTLGDVRRATTTVAEQAGEFVALQELLRPPKARGGIGEAMLEELLRQILPPNSYSIQHRFSSGTIVDALVKVGGKAVCIDSKFPLSNYRRMCDADNDIERHDAERAFAADVEGHIRAISSRYIVPDEGTFDFAVMYVPAEGVYGEVLRLNHRRQPLFETALAQRVVPMSPLTMYGYLQTVLFGLKCLRIEDSAQAILDFCGRLQQDMERFTSEYETLGRHIGNAKSKYEEGARRLDRFQSKLERVVDLADDADRLIEPTPAANLAPARSERDLDTEADGAEAAL